MKKINTFLKHAFKRCPLIPEGLNAENWPLFIHYLSMRGWMNEGEEVRDNPASFSNREVGGDIVFYFLSYLSTFV